jgi:GH15 family glucan-1,4-alpha-glucosidase
VTDSRHALPIEDYALIGDCNTTALVGRNGSIDWLCWPRFDSDACFAALLGTDENGRWLLAPADGDATVTRGYLNGGLVLETVFTAPGGSVALIDFMIPEAANSSIVRIVEGRTGQVAMTMELGLRFDYGTSVPWVTHLEGDGTCAIAGPNLTMLRTSVALEGHAMRTVAEFTVSAGEQVPFVLTYGASHLPPPLAIDAAAALAQTGRYWAEWSGRNGYRGEYQDAVHKSLLVLKALTYHPTGGIAAAPTTSLPEELGGSRNWDYRYCWLRDATLTLFSLMQAG